MPNTSFVVIFLILLIQILPYYSFIGSQDGKIHFWSTETGEQVHALEWHHEPPKVVGFNPKYMMFASADTNLVILFVFLIIHVYIGILDSSCHINS